MALKIIKASDVITVETIVMTLFAVPGVGKSTLGYSAANPLLLDFDRGAHRALGRKDTGQFECWEEVEGMEQSDFDPYDTIVADTAGRALDLLAIKLCGENTKWGRNGNLTLPGYGELKSRFLNWLKLLRSWGKDIVLIAHSEEKMKGDDMIERLDITGGSKGEIHKSSDAIGRLYLSNGQRMLNFSPTDSAYGKNPAGFDVLAVPDYEDDQNFLAQVITDTKSAMNTMTAEQEAVAKIMCEWKTRCAGADTPEEFDLMLVEVDGLATNAKENIKRLIWAASQDHGFTFDKRSKKFKAKK